MNLRKTLILASMALALVAFAAPAAQAQEHGLTEDGKFIAKGELVTLTSENLTTTTGLGTLSCAKVTLHYHVEENSDTHVALAPTPAGTPETTYTNATTENCLLNGSTVVHISKAGTHTVTINTWGHGEASASFTGRITSALGTITCTYSGKVTVQVTDGTDEVHVGPSTLTSACGNGTMHGAFTAETPIDDTHDGSPLIADIKTPETP